MHLIKTNTNNNKKKYIKLYASNIYICVYIPIIIILWRNTWVLQRPRVPASPGKEFQDGCKVLTRAPTILTAGPPGPVNQLTCRYHFNCDIRSFLSYSVLSSWGLRLPAARVIESGCALLSAYSYARDRRIRLMFGDVDESRSRSDIVFRHIIFCLRFRTTVIIVRDWSAGGSAETGGYCILCIGTV